MEIGIIIKSIGAVLFAMWAYPRGWYDFVLPKRLKSKKWKQEHETQQIIEKVMSHETQRLISEFFDGKQQAPEQLADEHRQTTQP
ncbi:MAG: hypothetical protein PHV74_06695 [Dehalococcoidia bacterium]|nr:hypothetical protein [Dehalococcoidia bacterium]